MTSADRRARERQELHDRILDAARELFARHGYEAVTLRKIAQAIEYTPAAIYGHFQDKDDLIRTLCKRDFDTLSARMAKLADVVDPLERVRLLGHGYIQFAIEHPQHYRLMFMSPAEFEHDETTLEGKGDPHRDGYAFLRLSVQQALDQGRMRDPGADADLLAQTFWAGVHGVASLQITHSSDEWVEWRGLEARAATMIDGLLAGLSKPGDPASQAPAAKPAGARNKARGKSVAKPRAKSSNPRKASR
jgi:AcrR family transcriptional regulator